MTTSMRMSSGVGHCRTATSRAPSSSSSSTGLIVFLVLITSSSLSSSSAIIFVGASVGAEFPIGASTVPPPLSTTRTTSPTESLSTAATVSAGVATTSSSSSTTASSSTSETLHSSQSSLLSTTSPSPATATSRVRIASLLRKLLFPSSSHHNDNNLAFSSTSASRFVGSGKSGPTTTSGSTATPSSLLLLLKSISLHGLRLLLAGYIAHATYQIIKEIWDDVQSELLAAQQRLQRGGGGGSGYGNSRFGTIGGEEDVREEQDMPYCSSSSSGDYLFGSQDENGIEDVEGEGKDIDDDDDESEIQHSRSLPFGKRTRRRNPQLRPSRDEDDDDDDDVTPPSHYQQHHLTPQMTATRILAQRLHSAGLPYASEVKKLERTRNGGRRGRRTTTAVEDILQSLTRAEGNILSQTLLSPLDDGMIAGSSPMMTASDGGEDEVEADMVSSATAAWNAIGGLTDAKESLLDLAFPLLPTTSTQSDSNNNNFDDHYGGLLSNPPGVLLYGPPGCGKGLLVRALASTIHARFLVVSPSVLLRKYVGETNINVRALFSVARKLSPTVIFVDELDGLFRERGGEDHDVGRDLKTEFLQLWDGIRSGGGGAASSSSASSTILVIGATNRPFDVDPAFLRRMPRKIYVGLPDFDSRISVLQGMLSRVPLDVSFDMALVATKTAGYSPSDIREVLQTAALFPLREARAEAIRNSSTNSSSSSIEDETDKEKKVGMVPITMPPLRRLRTEDVLRALEVSRPTHFSRKYRKELMNYIRNSGASSSSHRNMDNRDDRSPPPSVVDASENDYADGSTFYDDGSSHRQPQQEADSSSYDEDSSDDSDYYDDL